MFEVKASGKTTEIVLYNVIGDEYEGVTSKQFLDAVKSVKTDSLDLRINSSGGSVFEAVAMVTALDNFRRKRGEISVYIDGVAASAASVVAMAGDKITIAEGAKMMIHDPYALMIGGAGEMRRKADMLDQLKADMIKMYQRHSHLDAEKISELMTAETWMNGVDALDMGFVDVVVGEVSVAAFAGLPEAAKKFGYKHLPEFPKAEAKPEAEPEKKTDPDVLAWRRRIDALKRISR
jgi:ATP-dependent Clp protease protease subunit